MNEILHGFDNPVVEAIQSVRARPMLHTSLICMNGFTIKMDTPLT